MSKANALYWQGCVIDAAEDLITGEDDYPVSEVSCDPSGFNFTVKGDAEYRIEVRVFELKEGE